MKISKNIDQTSGIFKNVKGEKNNCFEKFFYMHCLSVETLFKMAKIWQNIKLQNIEVEQGKKF